MNNAIALVFDDDFARYAIACLNSIHANYPRHPDIIAYYPGTNPDVLHALERVSARPVASTPVVRAGFAHAPLGPIGNVAVYDRFMIWTGEFEDYDRVLYLDADTLVLHPLDDLFDTEGFFAVVNHEPTEYVRIFHPDQADNPDLRRLLREDGIEFPHHMDDMINAGVLSVPKTYRTEEHLNLLLELAQRYGSLLHYADQSLLSLWCRMNHISPSKDYRYNFQSPFFGDPDISVSFAEIRILHFSSPRKPPAPGFRNWERLGKAAAKCEQLFLHYADMSF